MRQSASSHKFHGQMSESFLTAAILSVSGGLQDAYTYISRGKVFANAQTGNIVLLSQILVERDFSRSIHYLVPLLFFAFGVAAAEIIRQKFRTAKWIHWRQLVLFMEIVLLFLVGFLPDTWNLLANAIVSFSCAMQVQAFRKVNGYAFASTMCIGNMRSGVESLCAYGRTHDKNILRKALYYFAIIVMFGLGAGFGGHLIAVCGFRTIWISCGLLFVSFLFLFIKEEIEEHPEIREEEKEISDNLHHIKEETEEVEHIIAEDLRLPHSKQK